MHAYIDSEHELYQFSGGFPVPKSNVFIIIQHLLLYMSRIIVSTNAYSGTELVH